MLLKTLRSNISVLPSPTTTRTTATTTTAKCNKKMRPTGISNSKPSVAKTQLTKRRAIFTTAAIFASGGTVTATAVRRAMHVLALTAFLQLLAIGVQALDENLTALNRHQIRSLHRANVGDYAASSAVASEKSPATAPRQRRSLANGRWGLRPGKRAAAPPAGDYNTLRLLAVDRPAAETLYDVPVPAAVVDDSSSESAEEKLSNLALDHHALLTDLPTWLSAASPSVNEGLILLVTPVKR